MAGKSHTFKLDIDGTALVRGLRRLLKIAENAGDELEEDLHITADVDTKKATRNLKGLTSTVNRVRDGFAQWGLAIQGVRSLAGGIVGAVKPFVEASAQAETYSVQLKVLLGSAEAAEDRLTELYDFAATTPFEIDEVVKASIQLQTLTKGALATGEGLRLVGDMAAAANVPFSEISMWVGRAYDAIQSGRPFGEAAMRLQELGLLSGETRAKLEQLQKTGADGSVIWEVFQEDMSRFSGMMEEQSKTFTGIISNLKDSWTQFLRDVGESVFFDLIKEKFDNMRTWIDENQAQVKRWANGIGLALATIVESFSSLISLLRHEGFIALTNFNANLQITGVYFQGLAETLKGLYDLGSLFNDVMNHALQTADDQLLAILSALDKLMHGDLKGALESLDISEPWQERLDDMNLKAEQASEAIIHSMANAQEEAKNISDAAADVIKGIWQGAGEYAKKTAEDVRQVAEGATTPASTNVESDQYLEKLKAQKFKEIDIVSAAEYAKLAVKAKTDESILEFNEITLGTMDEQWEEHSQHLSNLYDNIGRSFGNALAGMERSGWKLKNILQNVFDGIKQAFFRMVGDMVAEWIAAQLRMAAFKAGINIATGGLGGLLGFASGGGVPGGPRIIQVNEKGPEYVVNAEKTAALRGFLDFLNFSPLPLVQKALMGMPALRLPTPHPRMAYASGGLATGGNQLDTIVRQLDALNANVSALELEVGIYGQVLSDIDIHRKAEQGRLDLEEINA